MSPMLKKAIQFLIGSGIGAFCLYLVFKDIDTAQMWSEIRQVGVMPVVLFAVFIVVQFVIRTIRWMIQVEGVSKSWPPFVTALGINAVAFASVFLVPFRLGELVRPFLTQKHGYMSASEGLAHSAIERVTDGLITSVFFAVVLFVLDEGVVSPQMRQGGLACFGFFFFAAAVFLISLFFQERAVSFWRRMGGLFHERLGEFVASVVDKFLDGFRCFSSWKSIAGYVGLSASFWALNGVGVFLLLRGFEPEATLVTAFFAVCLMVIAVMLPAPPGNVGNFHYFTQLALVMMGITAAKATAFAVVAHALQVLILLVWAAIFIALGTVSLKSVREATTQQ